jgi:hypothetical protein
MAFILENAQKHVGQYELQLTNNGAQARNLSQKYFGSSPFGLAPPHINQKRDDWRHPTDLTASRKTGIRLLHILSPLSIR